jgi:hypothetical protein
MLFFYAPPKTGARAARCFGRIAETFVPHLESTRLDTGRATTLLGTWAPGHFRLSKKSNKNWKHWALGTQPLTSIFRVFPSIFPGICTEILVPSKVDERRAKAAEAHFHYLIPPAPGEADKFPFRDDPKAVEALQKAVEKIVSCAGKCIGNVTSQAVESLNALFADRKSKDVGFTATRESRAGISVLAWNDPEEWQLKYASRVGAVLIEEVEQHRPRQQVPFFVAQRHAWENGDITRLNKAPIDTLVSFYDVCKTPVNKRVFKAPPIDPAVRFAALEAFEKSDCIRDDGGRAHRIVADDEEPPTRQIVKVTILRSVGVEPFNICIRDVCFMAF